MTKTNLVTSISGCPEELSGTYLCKIAIFKFLLDLNVISFWASHKYH